MAATLDPVRPIKLDEIRQARERIAQTIVRTPLVRLELGPDFPDVRLKLENLQPINAYKLRGAANAVALLPEHDRKRGVWTISAGNAGQGVAYAARAAAVPCTVVAIETAPESKLARMRALGARLVLVSYDVAWKALDDRAFPGVDGTFVHPFDDDNFIAGHGSMGLEILEDAPDTKAIIASIGGGGLITGVASAIKAINPGIKIFGAEPETAAPAALSGVPFFFSGGWTKEEILHATSNWPQSHLPHYLMLIGVILTALYMTRQIIYVFFGNRRAASEHAPESPSVMTLPLIVLAVCAIFFSVVLTPAWPWLDSYLTGHPARFDPHLLIQPMIIVSLVLVGAGVAIGIWIYRRAGETDPIQHAQPALFRFLENKMWIDEIYDRTVIALSKILARLSDWMDRHVWDGLVRGVGAVGQFLARLTTGADERVINAGVDEGTIGAQGFGRVMSRWHSGQIQTYLGAVALGMLALVLLYAWLG